MRPKLQFIGAPQWTIVIFKEITWVLFCLTLVTCLPEGLTLRSAIGNDGTGSAVDRFADVSSRSGQVLLLSWEANLLLDQTSLGGSWEVCLRLPGAGQP